MSESAAESVVPSFAGEVCRSALSISLVRLDGDELHGVSHVFPDELEMS